MKKNKGQRKYKVEYIQTEKYIIDVYAKNQEEAEKIANERWQAGDYQETGDIEVTINNVYDVTDTDDPFYA